MSPSAMDASSLERHLSSAEEAQLAEALELRRKQIDREIAEFTAEKENEFRKFEKRLRSEKRDLERQKILQCEREVDKANQKRRRSSDQLRACSISQSSGTRKKELGTRGTRSEGVRFSEATEIPLDLDQLQPNQDGNNSKKGGVPQHQQPFHERELEFQGLFTPSYLPLLNGQHQNLQDGIAQATSSETKQPSRPKQTTLPSEPALLRTQTQVSGSAPTTPTASRYLSSSDPRKMSMAERRSSSRSDTSVSSLRSSIRDKKQVRSPKRVLFSIDNVVVSPSTSPTIQRKMDALGKDGDSDRDIDLAPQVGAASMTKAGVDEGFHPSALRRGPSGHSGRTTLTNAPTTTGGHTSSGSKLQHPAAQIWSTSPSMGGDGFEHVGGGEDDDLFAFDEDVSYREKESRDDEDMDEETKDDELENGNNGLPTSSPHAGSLPIEIKWPGRKDPRG